jgi:hypothetical protein
MSRIAAALLCLGLAACGQERAPLDSTCTESPEAVLRALRAVPGRVRLASGTPLSQCVARARTDAELQTVGLVLTNAAERLARRAEHRDEGAALQLGYLAGAVRRGAARTAGIHAELERRVARAGAFVDEAGPRVERALLRGIAAGEARG